MQFYLPLQQATRAGQRRSSEIVTMVMREALVGIAGSVGAGLLA